MPTAARLAGAAMFVLLAFIASSMMLPLFGEGAVPRQWLAINIFAALLAGWATLGSRAGQGMTASFANAFTALGVFLFWMLFIHGFNEMVDRAFRKYYDGSLEAIVAIFQQMIEIAGKVFTLETVGFLIVGSLVASFAAEYAARHFR